MAKVSYLNLWSMVKKLEKNGYSLMETDDKHIREIVMQGSEAALAQVNFKTHNVVVYCAGDPGFAELIKNYLPQESIFDVPESLASIKK